MMNETTFHGPVLLVGGKGKTGSRVAARLETKGVSVRIVSRSTNPAFDWVDRQTWLPAIQGMRAAYITYHPDLAVPGAADAIGAFSHLAVANGLSRLVLLSGRGETEAQDAEQALIASGADWTVVRAAWFAQNFSENFLAEGVVSGNVAFAADTVREPFIDADDIADVVTAALTEHGHAGEIYEVTGPRLLTFAEAVSEIAAATGRTIQYTPLSVDEFVLSLQEAGVPNEYIDLLHILTRDVLDGRNQTLSDGVRQALGREPRDFKDYARLTALSGAWNR